MATTVTGHPPPPTPNLISSRSSWGKHPLKIWLKSVQGFRLWNTHKLYARHRRNKIQSIGLPLQSVELIAIANAWIFFFDFFDFFFFFLECQHYFGVKTSR